MATALKTAAISKSTAFIPVATPSLNGPIQRKLLCPRLQRVIKHRSAEEVCTASLAPKRESASSDSSARITRVAQMSFLSSLLSSFPVRAEELEEIAESAQESITGAAEEAVSFVESAVEGAADMATDVAETVVAGADGFTAFAESAVEGAADLAGGLVETVVAGTDGFTAFAESAVGGAADLAGEVAGAVVAGADEIASGAVDIAQDAVSAAAGSPELVVGAAGAAILAIPVLLFSLFRKGYAGDVTAKEALDTLLDDKAAVLLDVRDKIELDEAGSPKVPGKKPVSVPFLTEAFDMFLEDPDFASKVSAVKSLSDFTVAVYIIDRFGPTAVKAAKVLTKAGYKKVFAIKGGAEGPGGWKESGLAWREPFVPFKLDLTVLKEAITSASSITEGNTALVPTTIGATAALGLGILAFSEVETALQLLGSAALFQVFLKKFLFAEDRKQTLAELQTFLDTKVAPASLVEEFKEIGNVLTSESSTMSAKPKPKKPAPLNGAVETTTTTTKAAEPAAAPPSNGSATEAVTVESPPPPAPVETPVESSAEAIATPSEPSKVEPAAPEPSEAPSEAPVAASSSIEASSPTEASSSTDIPPSPVPLSPYTTYPELQPPTSPTPSAPTSRS